MLILILFVLVTIAYIIMTPKDKQSIDWNLVFTVGIYIALLGLLGNLMISTKSRS